MSAPTTGGGRRAAGGDDKTRTPGMKDPGISASLAIRVAAWALVGIPLAWGVWQVLQKSLDLFR